jgi:excisionase family DNA binding protein
VDPSERLFTVAETAVLIHSSQPTVRRMIRRGDLAAIRVSPRGLRVWASSVEALLLRGCAPERRAA